MGQFGLMIVNGDSKLVTEKVVKANGFENLIFAKKNHRNYKDFEAGTWILKRDSTFQNCYLLELPVGELHPRLVSNIQDPKIKCSAIATRRELKDGYQNPAQALWKI